MLESVLLVDSTLSLSTTSRLKRAVATWEHSRLLKNDELERDRNNNLVWYCKYCVNYHCASTTTARSYLLTKHDIKIEENRQLVVLKEKAMSNISERLEAPLVEHINEALL